MEKKKIYFLCTGNSCRSQMAEGFAKKYLTENYEIRSAGIEQHGLNPKAVEVMKEVEIDISSHTSDLIDMDYFMSSDLIITLCGDARDTCPRIPSTIQSQHWDLQDPARAEGTEDEIMNFFREVRDDIEERVKKLNKLKGEYTMPTPHIEAQKGEIADKILLPGDPLRAKYIAENFLEDAVQFNSVRNMFGFTGTYKGQRVSVMGTGMGMPSISIYANELITEYGVKKLIRVGTAGSVNENVKIRDLVIGQGAATTSAIIRNDYPAFDFPQIADFDLLDKSYHIAKDLGITTHVGNIVSSDLFYDGPNVVELGKVGVLAVEMEAAALYYLGAKHKVQTLGIMTISDELLTGNATSPEERQTSFTDMMKVGLETLIAE